MTPTNSLAKILKRCARSVAPPPVYTVSQWSDAERKLSPEASAEPGQWNTDRTPYLRGVMDAINDPEVEVVAFMKSAQVGATESLLNTLGYFMAYDPAPILLLQPTLEMAETFSKDRLAPMLRDTPALRGKVSDSRARDSGNTMLHKVFPGGHLTMAGANSPASLASRPIRVVLCDEVDRYPASAGTEGDPVALATKRTTTFWNRKIVLTSTPTTKGTSRIESAFEEGDRRRYHLPCPACGFMQPLKWRNLDHKTLTHACEHCGVMSKEIAWKRGKGEWIAEGVARTPRFVSFHISELYSPWKSWASIVDDWRAAQGNTERLKTFINTSLGESWEEEGESLDPTLLIARREEYGSRKTHGDRVTAPADVLCVTAGVDVQQDRLEIELVGWGLGEESWSLAVAILWGDTKKAEIYADLDDYLSTTIYHANGHQLSVNATCIDSGGSSTQAVYEYCRGKVHRRIFAIKGVGGPGIPIVGSPSRRKAGRRDVDLFPVGVDEAKAVVYSRLRVKEPGPGYCHFSVHVNDEEYFAQITAEKLVKRYVRGFAKLEWQLVRANKRNEALDRRVYATAAVKLLSPSWKRLAQRMGVVTDDALKDDAEDADQGAVEAASDVPAEKPGFVIPDVEPEKPPVEPTGSRTEDKPAKLRQRARVRRGGFVGRWRL